MSILQAVQSNDRLATLEALRDSVAVAIDNCPSGRDIASLSKRLMEIMAEIDAISGPDEADDDEMIIDALA